jgi:hypothetical protein
MIWLAYLGVGLLVCFLGIFVVLFFRKQGKLKARAQRLGVCTQCSVPYDTRRKLEYIRKPAGGGMYQQCDVWVTEVYCPQCGVVKESDCTEAMRRAEEETVW